MSTAVVILAGGDGRRIGGAKPLRLLGGQQLIERAIDIARSLSPRVAVSVRDDAQLGDLPVERIFDETGIGGPLGGLASALAFAETHRANQVLTIPCDAPFLPDDLLVRLSEALQPGIAAAVASSGGRLHPTCALWRRHLRVMLEAYLQSGERSLQGFAEHVGHAAVEWPTDPIDPFFNINSEADLAVAEKLLTKTPSP
jgi:molybdopterin-guanine dinucleotide biosynthesis protein A